MSDETPPVTGLVNEGLGAVADAMRASFRGGLELGASFAAVVDGELVVDIIAGHVDRKRETPWSEDSLACVYSTGKAVTALLIAKAVSDGALDYDEPVARFWPDFAAAGKGAVTVAQALSHQAGLPGFNEEMAPEDWLDWDKTAARIAAMAPMWPPGSRNGYHPQTVGFIAGELLRRTTGKTVGALVGELRATRGFDVHCGLDESALARTVMMPKPPRAPDLGELNEFTKAAFLKPWSAPGKVSREDWARAELPASNMHATARGLAEILVPFANDGAWPDGETFLSPEALEGAFRERIRGDDLVLPFHLSWSAGLMRNINHHFGPNGHAFGHAGFGGSCVVIDPSANLVAAYVMNRMSEHLVGDPRAVRLIEALYRAM